MQNKTLFRFIVPTIMLTLMACTFGYTINLEQRNSEKVFLTQSGLKNYENYLETHSIKSLAIAKFNDNRLLEQFKENPSLQNQIIESCQENDCQFILPSSLPENAKEILPLKTQKSFAAILVDDSGGKDIKQMISNIGQSNQLRSKQKRIQFGGIPYTNMKLDEYSRSIKEKLFPTFFILSFLFILYLFKNIWYAVALFLPCLASSLISLSWIKFLYYQSNLVLAIIPLIMFILNMSLLFHIFYTAFDLKRFNSALKEKKKPIALMIFSTFIGLLSLKTSDIAVIQEFGFSSAILLIISSSISVIWSKALDHILPLTERSFRPRELSIIKIASPINRKTIFIFSFSSVLLGSYLFLKIPVLTNANNYFPAEDKVKQDLKDISKSFLGSPLVDILIPIDKFETLYQIENIEHQIEQELKDNYKYLSANKVVRFANKQYAKLDQLPKNKFAYQALLSQAPAALGSAYGNLDQYRVTIFGDQMNVDQYENLLSKLNQILEGNNFKYQFNGLTYQLMIAQKEMIFTLFKSFSGTLLIIAFMSLILFKTFKIFGIILLVNVIPVFLTFIFYFISGISFNIATVMTFSISLGIIVDSTFHQLHALSKEEFSPSSYEKTVVNPIGLSAIILSSCFFMFAFNPFLPIRHFGISLCFIILVGAFFDLKVLPTLLGRMKVT